MKGESLIPALTSQIFLLGMKLIIVYLHRIFSGIRKVPFTAYIQRIFYLMSFQSRVIVNKKGNLKRDSD